MTGRTPQRWRRQFVSGAVLLLAGWICSCGHRQTPVEQGIRDGKLLVGNSSEPRDLDPNTAISVTETTLLLSLFNGLVAYAPDCRSVVPADAQSWTISPDEHTYTFHLRPGLRWSNGDPLTAEDYQYSFRRLIEPALGAENAIYADWVVGARDYRQGTTHDLSAVGFRAVDPQTFEIRLIQRAPFFLGLLATNPFYPLHRHTIEQHDAYLRRDGAWTRPGSLVSNGPFRLTAWRISSVITGEKNPYYWDAAHVRLHAVSFFPIDNSDTEERAFRGGALHVTRTVPTQKIPVYLQEHPSPIRRDPLVACRYLTFNVTKAPFTDPRVRRALALAVDRRKLVDDVLRNGSRVADGLTVPGSGQNYQPRALLGYDPAQARALLAEAGFPGGAGMPPITVNFTEAHINEQAILEAIQAMWSRELGIHIDLITQEEKVWLDTLRTKNFQLLMDGWSCSVNDPIDLLQLFLANSPNNDSSWGSPEYDREYAAAGDAPNDAERNAHLANADAILTQELPFIPLWHSTDNYLVHPAVDGWQENLLGIHLWSAAGFRSGHGR